MPAEIIEGPGEGIAYPQQGTSPRPAIHVVPSERALAFQSVDFNAIYNQIHYDLSFWPHRVALKNIRLLVVDYTTLPYENSGNKTVQTTLTPQTTVADRKPNSRQPRYFMTMSFYEGNNRPPCPAAFEATAYIRKNKIPPQEAMRLMARDLLEEFHSLTKVSIPVPLKKMVLSLD